MGSLPQLGSERRTDRFKVALTEIPKMNRSFGVKLEGNGRPRGTERRGLSPDVQCLGITTTGPLSGMLAAAVLTPGLLSIHSALPLCLLWEIKDSGLQGLPTGTPTVCAGLVSLITGETWLCEDILCVRVELRHRSLPCDFPESVASRTGEDLRH